MSRHLVINWNAGTLRYLYADADRQGNLRVVNAGLEELSGDGEGSAAIVGGIQQLIVRLKAEKSRLLVLMNRGSVDSARFTVPPASESELPALVQNMAVRDIPGATDQTPIDFVAYPPRPDGSRSVSAMALVADEHLLIRQLVAHSGCKSQRVLVSTHPLRAFVPELFRLNQQTDVASAAMLIISRGDDIAEMLVCVGELPLVSRTIRLAADVPQLDINRYLCSEAQRTLISSAGKLDDPVKIMHVVIVGNEQQTEGLDDVLSEHFQVAASVVQPISLLTSADAADPDVSIVNSGSFAPLLAAAFEDAASIAPAIDFANPRRPPLQANRTRQIAAVAATLGLIIGGGWYYVWNQFSEIERENARLVTRLNELNELVKETQAKRQLATTLSAWDKNRISWPDELRDLTTRIPSSPDLVIQQLSISAGSPGTAVATFRGVGKQPEVIAQMESNLRDKYHDIRVPGVREQMEGTKITSAFQATLTIRKRPPSQYIIDSEATSKSNTAHSTVRTSTTRLAVPQQKTAAGKGAQQP